MGSYNFYERNKKTIDELPNWSLKELIGVREVAIRELENVRPTCHPDFIEMLECSKKELDKHIRLKTQQQRSTEEVSYENVV